MQRKNVSLLDKIGWEIIGTISSQSSNLTAVAEDPPN
jgi:hypothetical protein